MVDAALSKLVLSDCSLDHVWLPETFLMQMRKWGDLRAIKLNHDRREMLAGTKKQAAKRNEKLGMELKGLFVEDGLEFFVQNARTRDYANLSAIQIRRTSNDSSDPENAGFSIDDVKFTGKFTTRGTSFEQHLKLVETTRDRYSSVIIDQIEDKTLELRQGRVKGNFFIFRYERRIDDFERFIDYTFSGTEPFRLWALPTQLSKDAYRVVGTDIHSGSQFHAEVFPTYMRFYLHKGSCGNTVSRLWTNLQTYYSGTTQLLDSQGEEFVSF